MAQPEDQSLPSLVYDLGELDASPSDKMYGFLVDDIRDPDVMFEDATSQDKPQTTLQSVDPTATVLDPMDVQLPSLSDHSFSPTFHEWNDHNRFFSEKLQTLESSAGEIDVTPASFDTRDLDALQRALFSVDGLPSAVWVSHRLLGIDPREDLATTDSNSSTRPPGSSAGESEETASGQKSWTPLPATLELQLVQIYFQTMHTLCPVLDELEFYQWYQKRRSEQIADFPRQESEPLRELVFHTIIFSAFAHVDEEQLKQSPYVSVPHGQKTLFGHARDRYNEVRDAHQGAIELVQTSLILSHWSPYDETREVNYFWGDEALRHALLAKLHSSNLPHHRIIWWCGLQRNRTLTLALRRPHKLKQYPPGRLPRVSDFGSRRLDHNMPLKGPKIYAALLFISLCKLSVIMNEIVLLRHNSNRWDDWRGKDYSSNKHGSDLDRIVAIDKSLVEWNVMFERSVRDFDESKIPRRMRVSGHVLRIMSQSTKASLFEQYIELSDDQNSIQWLLNYVAVNKLKETSAAIAVQVGNLLADAAVQDLPLNVPAWVMLPVSVLLSQIKSSDKDRRADASKLLEMLLGLFSCMKERFAGVQHTASVINALVKTFDGVIQESDHLDRESLERQLIAHGRSVLRVALGIGAIVQN
ncbi:hypothetical protein B0A52_08431 [Exophiala mesophila]|uniref:Transcription factor domain-containing protein n=1 Tax=Exophiala mesophila TaxID=212818 RepID=A0A438MYN0_EXOME|nr:hypothetical protein B0A52_08431 [Exophiala mesophila]